MVNEFGNIGEGLDIGGSPREDVNKVTEEAVRRIQDESKQAKQVHQQIQQDKKTNNKLADFLSFLINDIKDEKIITLLHGLFFKTKDQSTGINYLRKKINVLVIIGFFFPFYTNETDKHGISKLFEELIENEQLTLNSYINYIKKLSSKYHDNIPLDSDLLIEFLIAIVTYFKIHNFSAIDGNEHQELILKIRNELYN